MEDILRSSGTWYTMVIGNGWKTTCGIRFSEIQWQILCLRHLQEYQESGLAAYYAILISAQKTTCGQI